MEIIAILFVALVLGWAAVDTWLITRRQPIHENESRSREDAIVREQCKNRRKSDDFKLRKERETEKMRKEFGEAIVAGRHVALVGDMIWWPHVDGTKLLAACELDDGSVVVVGREDNGEFVLPDSSDKSHLLASLATLPKLQYDDDGIFVWLTEETYLIVGHHWDKASSTHRWQHCSVGCTGSLARKKLAESGIRFDA